MHTKGTGTGHGINKCNFILERRDKITDYYDSENANIGPCHGRDRRLCVRGRCGGGRERAGVGEGN